MDREDRAEEAAPVDCGEEEGPVEGGLTWRGVGRLDLALRLMRVQDAKLEKKLLHVGWRLVEQMGLHSVRRAEAAEAAACQELAPAVAAAAGTGGSVLVWEGDKPVRKRLRELGLTVVRWRRFAGSGGGRAGDWPTALEGGGAAGAGFDCCLMRCGSGRGCSAAALAAAAGLVREGGGLWVYGPSRCADALLRIIGTNAAPGWEAGCALTPPVRGRDPGVTLVAARRAVGAPLGRLEDFLVWQQLQLPGVQMLPPRL